jgi:hypothetical protein
MTEELFISVDIECNGPIISQHSMISMGSVVFTFDRTNGECREVSAKKYVFEEQKGHTSDPNTMEWWSKQGTKYEESRVNPRPPEVVMQEFVEDCKSLCKTWGTKKLVFVYYPSVFDGSWMDQYLLMYAPGGRNDFMFRAYDLKSFAAAHMKLPWTTFDKKPGNPLHRFISGDLTHDPVDDARQQGRTFCNILSENLEFRMPFTSNRSI